MLKKLIASVGAALIYLASCPEVAWAACPNPGPGWGGYWVCGATEAPCFGFSGTIGVYTYCSFWTRMPFLQFGATGPGTEQVHLAWCGIGGKSTLVFAQLGIEFDLTSTGTYSPGVWWAVGSGSINIFGSPPAPGDILQFIQICTATCIAGNAGQTWSFTVNDYGQKSSTTPIWTATHTATSATDLQSVGIEMEGTGGFGLANFGQMPAYNIQIAQNGAAPGAPALTSSMANYSNQTTQGGVGAGTFFGGPPNAAGNGFNWGYNPASSTCQAIDTNVTLQQASGDPN